MCQPLQDLQVTDTFNKIAENVKEKSNFILHCYGFPGSGKSQLVRSLAVKFPYLESIMSNDFPSNSPFIKWHIQCKDMGDDLKEQFLKLLAKIKDNGYGTAKKINLKSLEEDFKNNQANSFVNVLINCKVPVLIIVEDPPKVGRNMILNLFHNLKQYFRSPNQATQTKFHVYVTSRSKSSIVVDQSMPPIEHYENRGFNEEEGIRFLQASDGDSADTIEDLTRVYQRFSGLPLGLLAAKRYCKRAGLSYQDYLKLVDDNCYRYEILKDEEEVILIEYGQSARHVLQAIVMPFFSSNETNQFLLQRPKPVYWKILCCISYFHYDRIPRYLLNHCCHAVKESRDKLAAEINKADVNQLIAMLSDYSMCTETSDGAITFHEVVQNAFRLKQQSIEDFNPLVKATKAICGLVSLDMRRKENSNRMNELLPHMQALLTHLDKNLEMLESDEDFKMLKPVMSHLYQAVGALLLSDSKNDETNALYRKSLEMIWPEMIDVVTSPKSRAADGIAEEVVQKSEAKAQHLPKDFIVKYSSWIKLSHFEEDEVAFLRSESQGNFEDVENLFQTFKCKALLVEKLRDCKLFLTEEQFRPIFFAERLASILHSWSRCFLFREQDPAMQRKCLWMNTLCKSVSDYVCKFTTATSKTGEIRLLTQWLAQISGLVPLLLKQSNNDSLQEAEKLCEEMISNEELKLYEMGLLKKAFNPPMITRCSLLRYIVRINTKLVKSSNQSVLQLQQADEKCQQLLQLITENFEVLSNYIHFISYCGKYYAAKNDFAQAVTCFKQYFDLFSKQNLTPKFYNEFWVTYNYARAVVAWKDASFQDKEVAIQKCKKVLACDKVFKIQESLKQNFIKKLNKLQTT